MPNLGGLDNAVLWPDFKAVWPGVSNPGVTGSPTKMMEEMPSALNLAMSACEMAYMITKNAKSASVITGAGTSRSIASCGACCLCEAAPGPGPAAG